MVLLKVKGRKNPKKSKNFTQKGERLIQVIKKHNKTIPKSKQVNPFALATSMGFRRKTKNKRKRRRR